MARPDARRKRRSRSTAAPGAAQTTVPRGLRLSALIMTATVVVVRPLFAGTPSDYPLTVLLMTLLLLAVALVLTSQGLQGRLSLRLTALHLALALFAVAALWGAASSRWQPEAVLRGFDYVSLVLLLFLVVELTQELRERQLLLLLALSSFFVVVVYGLYQYFYEFAEMARQIAENPGQVRGELGISPEDWPDFLARFRAREIYSTFLMSNSLAGYLILLLPVLTGYVFDYVKAVRTTSERTSVIPYLVMLVAGFAALSLTRSKGAWLALGCGVVLGTPVLLLWRHLRRVWPILLVGSALAGAFFCWWLAGADVSSRVLRNDSLGVRLGYWQGTLAVTAKHPLAGVGLGRFPDHYLQEKLPSAQEVKLPHSMWLETWVEMGLLGLMALVAVSASAVGLAFGAAARPTPADATEPIPRSSGCLYAGVAGVLALCILWWLGGSWQGSLGWGLGALWLATAVFFIYSAPDRLLVRAGRGVRWGLALGLVAFLLHGTMDIDLYAPGITTVLVVLLGTVVVRTELKVRSVPLPGWGKPAVCVVGLVLVVGFARGLSAPLMEAQSRKALARQLTFEDDLNGAVEQLSEVVESHPNDSDALKELAGLLGGRAGLPGAARRDDLERAQALWQRFIEIRPESFLGYYQLGMLYRQRARSEPDYLQRAAAAYRQAVGCYPTLPAIRIDLGQLYEELGRRGEARLQYREVLRLAPLITQNVRKLSKGQVEEVEGRLRKLGEQAGSDG